MLPFLFFKSFKEIQEIKISDIEIHEFNRCLVVKHINPLTKQNYTVKIDNNSFNSCKFDFDHFVIL